MTTPFMRGGDTGSPTFGHALLSSGDELQEMAVAQKRRISGRRKNLRMKKAKARNAARISAVNDSDASVEDAENNADDDAALDSSASDDDKPGAFAPSGALKKSAMSKYKLKRHPLNTPVRQAGRTKSSPLSPTTLRLQALASPYRTRNSEKVRFDLENVAKRTPTPVEEVVENLTDNLDSGSDDDDAAYAQLNLIPDSDSAEEDDDAIEDLETQYLIEHLEANGELPLESAFSSVYDDMEHSAQFDNTESELDSYFIVPTTELGQETPAAATTAEHSPILGAAFDASPVDMNNSVEMLPMPMPELIRPKPEAAETGLQTPSSLPQSIIMRDYDDDEETEAEEPRVGSVSGARLKRLSGYSAPAATPKGVRKSSKPKTPKLGSFKIPRKDTILQHKNGELVFSRKGKVAANGTITPKGVLTSDSKHKKPIKAIPLAESFMQAIAAPSSAITSPTTAGGNLFGNSTLQESPVLTSDVGLCPSAEQQAEELFKDFIVSKN